MKKLLTRRYIPVFVAIALVGVLAVGTYYVLQIPPPNTFVLRKDGWHPREMVVAPGTLVTFVNKTSNAFWPASNSHPQHDQYAAFDSGRPVPAGESWSFTFEDPGRWTFHDHLRSFYLGAIAVGEEYANYDCMQDLADADVAKKRVCWSEKLYEELQEKGAAAAFQLLSVFYADPDFTKVGCHIIVHQLGDNAYGEYLRYGSDLSRLEFPPESVYCGYGYYHGILEHLIRDNPDFKKADAFCKRLITEYEDTIPRIRFNCYHAIGHGFVPEPTDIEMWGSVPALTAPAIVACKNIPDEGARGECFQGSFNVMGDWMWNNQFGLRFPAIDSLAVCRLFDSEVSRACYYELAMRLLPSAGDNLIRVYESQAASIEDDAIAGMVMNSAAAGLVGAHITETDFVPYLLQCRALPDRVQENCLHGLSGGFVAHGEPENEYIKAIAFCSDARLTASEKNVCYENIVRTFKGSYTREKVAEVCMGIEENYQHYCSYDP